MMTSGGRYEIGAAKQRLAAAKMQASSATKNMESAKTMEENAHAMMESAKAMMKRAKKGVETARLNRESALIQVDFSQKEVEQAEQFLKESESRWAIIDVDSDGDEETDTSGKKRKEPSATDGVIVVDAESDSEAAESVSLNTNESSVVDEKMAGSLISSYGHYIGDVNSSSIRAFVANGCGYARVNGTYKRSTHLINGSPSFYKNGMWKGTTAAFVLFKRKNYWFIGVCPATVSSERLEDVNTTLYRTMTPFKSGLLPKEGWITVGEGRSPAPHLI